MSNLHSRLKQLIDTFIDDVTDLAKKTAIDTLASALGRAAVPGAAAPQRAIGRTGRSGKRTATELTEQRNGLLRHLVSHPGQRVEEINRALGTSTKDLALPLRQLVAAGKLRVEGKKRATKYFPGGKRGKKS